MPKSSKKGKMATTTLESQAYMQGLFADFAEQMNRYKSFITQLLAVEARLDLAEKTLCLTREHLQITMASTEGMELPSEWKKTLAQMRFVGVRLADACVTLLQKHKTMSPNQLMDALNEGTFRFRTNSPFREIHAALLRHPHVERKGSDFVWTAPAEEQLPMRLRVVRRELIPVDAKEIDASKSSIG
jgi:hypothetical protein